jgi:hypothetical protein
MTNRNNSGNDTEKNTVFLAGSIEDNEQNPEEGWREQAIKNARLVDISVIDQVDEQRDWEEEDRAIHAYFRQKQHPAE